MATTPLALPPALPSELLTYILTHQTYPTTLLICQRRCDFLTSLLSCIPPPQPAQEQPASTHLPNETTPSSSSPLPAVPPALEEQQPRHHLLIPTLHQIATARHISVVYLPSVSHLRAYLAVFPPPPLLSPSPSQQIHRADAAAPPPPPPPPQKTFDKPSSRPPLVVIYGLVELHNDTSEWSAQGLGRSLAALVQAGWRSGRRVVLMEERKGGLDGEGEVLDDEEEGEEEEDVMREDLGVARDGEYEDDVDQARDAIKRKKGVSVWEQKVPMLTGSVRRAGFDSDDAAWSGRTIEVGRIVARWFEFGRSDWDEHRQN